MSEDVQARVEVWRGPTGRLRLRVHHRTRRELAKQGARFDAAGAVDVADADHNDVLAVVPENLRPQLDAGVRVTVSREAAARWCLAGSPPVVRRDPDDLHLVTHVAGLSARDLASMLLAVLTCRTKPVVALADALAAKAQQRDLDAAACDTEQFAAVCRQDAADLRDLAVRLRRRA